MSEAIWRENRLELEISWHVLHQEAGQNGLSYAGETVIVGLNHLPAGSRRNNEIMVMITGSSLDRKQLASQRTGHPVHELDIPR